MAPVIDANNRYLLVDGTSLHGNAKGVGRYTYHICRELDERLPPNWQMNIVVFKGSWPVFPPSFRGSFHEISYKTELELGLRYFPVLMRQLPTDIFIRPRESIGINYRLPTITVCHDLNEIIWQYQPHRTLARRLFDAGCQALRIYALRQSTLVICNSEFVRNAAVEQYCIPKERTQIGYCGVDERFYELSRTVPIEKVRQDYNNFGYLLAFATGDYRENYTFLPALLERLKRLGYPGSLVVAGVQEEATYAINLFNNFATRGLVRNQDYFVEPFLGENQFNRLVELYTAADFYLELSWHEGFGMQLAEAMACGTTCISTGSGALQEVGDQWVIPIEPDKPEQIAEKIMQAWHANQHQRNNLPQVEYTKRFSWTKVGEVLENFLTTVPRHS